MHLRKNQNHPKECNSRQNKALIPGRWGQQLGFTEINQCPIGHTDAGIITIHAVVTMDLLGGPCILNIMALRTEAQCSRPSPKIAIAAHLSH